MRVFQRLNVAESVELVSQVVNELQMVTPEWEVLGTVQTGESGTGWKPDQLAYQPDLEDILSARGVELGVRLLMGTTAAAIQQDADGVSTTVVTSADTSSGSRTIRSRYVVGADGATSFVRSEIGAKRLDLGFSGVPQLVVDFEYTNQDEDVPELDTAYLVLDPDRPYDVGRYGGRRNSRLELVAKPGETREYLEREDTVWKLLAPWGATPERVKIIRAVVYDFESSLAEPWRVDRVLLAGDAAHTMPPYMGQGMLAGVRDAENLAWKIAAVVSGDADEKVLDTYQTERAPHAKAFIEMSMAIASMARTTDPEQVQARDEMLRSGQMSQPPFPRLGEGIVRPAGENQVEGRPGLQARVATGTRADRLDNLLDNGRSWRLVCRHAIPDELFTESQKRVLDSLDMQYAHVHRGMTTDSAYFWDIDAEYDAWYRRTGCKAYIERPDRYIFGAVASLDELPALVDELIESLAANGWHAAQREASSQ